MRGDVRDKAFNALRQLIDEIDSGRFPGLFLVITGTPPFYEGPSGISRLAPLAQRLATDFSTDPRFDNPRAVQIRLPGFDRPALRELGAKVRDLYASGADQPERVRSVVDDTYVIELADAVTGSLGGQVGVAPRIFLKKLIADVLDRVDQFGDFDPRKHYALTLAPGELTDDRSAAPSAAARAGTEPGRRDRPRPAVTPSGLDRLHPVLTHHLVNTPGLEGAAAAPGRGDRPGPGRAGHAPARADRRRQDRGGRLPLLTAMEARRWAPRRCSTSPRSRHC